jgi:hypothetical protein
VLCGVLWWRTGQVLEVVRNFGGAILETLADPDAPAVIGRTEHAAARVVDARSLTDEELMAEVLRRNGGHRPEEQA